MTRLNWNDPTKRLFEAGLDRGVLYPNNGPAVPWNGLTAVDEKGAESTKAYYLDGRPYLFVPGVKEYEATLRAFTYPDEFDTIMGTAEAVDGMFLDSQQSDSFGLSYRTLVGDGLTGTDKAYKLHLVFNAVALLTEKAYSTLGSSVDPMEFEWTIQAVPVDVPGFNATAHFIIDSRRADKEKLAFIEQMLYGTATSDAHMPSPSLILDTLSYDETIVVIDNGDGTWTATGSYKNLQLGDDGKFTIDSDTAINNPDGTWILGDGQPNTPVDDYDGGSPAAEGSNYDGGTPDVGGTTYDDGTP